ncbi:MAG: flagellar export chaperone FliS [Nocardioidaceae bacterium]
MTVTARSTYMTSMVSTVSAERLLVLLYERLLLDLDRAETAAIEGRHEDASAQLMHAQDIVLELLSSLRKDLWDGADRLASLYAYLHNTLVQANVRRDPELTALCRDLVTPIGEAWNDAATQLAGGAVTVASA